MLLTIAQHLGPRLALKLQRIANEADAVARCNFRASDEPETDAAGQK